MIEYFKTKNYLVFYDTAWGSFFALDAKGRKWEAKYAVYDNIIDNTFTEVVVRWYNNDFDTYAKSFTEDQRLKYYSENKIIIDLELKLRTCLQEYFDELIQRKGFKFDK